jgi:hypothetical protein
MDILNRSLRRINLERDLIAEFYKKTMQNSTLSPFVCVRSLFTDDDLVGFLKDVQFTKVKFSVDAFDDVISLAGNQFAFERFYFHFHAVSDPTKKIISSSTALQAQSGSSN